MKRFTAGGIAAVMGLISSGCAGLAQRPLIDPSSLSFPLAEAGRIDVEGTVVGQPRARDGVVYLATREGVLTAVVAAARSVLWRFKADSPFSVGPELGDGHVILRDEGNTLYVVDSRGGLVLKKKLGETVTTPVRERSGRLFFGTEAGKILAVDLSAGGPQVWEHDAGSAIVSGPVFPADLVIFGAADGKLLALNPAGKLVWEFAASGEIPVDPLEAGGRLYFGTADRFFYGLRAATGKELWSRRLQGAPLHPAVVRGGRLAVAASNSVVYLLSLNGGSILAWEAVPSRVVHELALAGARLLVTGGGPELTVLEFGSGKRLGRYLASGPLAAGALWVSPFIVLIEWDEERGKGRMVMLLSKSDSAGGDGR